MGKYYLLTGAGFSQNFGGMLASELWAVLYGHSKIQNNDRIKRILWDNREHGFEVALEEVRQLYLSDSDGWEEDYKTIQAIIRETFQSMDRSFGEKLRDQGFQKNFGQSTYRLTDLFKNFDVIFTTNQDMLIERHFINLTGGPISHLGHPGMKSKGHPQSFRGAFYQGEISENMGSSPIQIQDKDRIGGNIPNKSYVKLHGSHNWEGDKEQLLIMGGQKEERIGSQPLLAWYFCEFTRLLKESDTRLMILGYSFSDSHINKIILDAVRDHGLKFYIWNPSGIDGVTSALKKLDQYDDNFFQKGLIRECQKNALEVANSDEELDRIKSDFFRMTIRHPSCGYSW